jgi:hypothetical protein
MLKTSFIAAALMVALLPQSFHTKSPLNHFTSAIALTKPSDDMVLVDAGKMVLHVDGHKKVLVRGDAIHQNPFGKPESFSKDYWEMDEDTATVYHYKGADLYFLQNKLEMFEISSGKWYLGGADGKKIKVGDDVKALESFVPGYKFVAADNQDGEIGIFLKDDGEPIEMLFYIKFDKTTYKITELSLSDASC